MLVRIALFSAYVVALFLLAVPAYGQPPLSGADWENNGGLFELSYRQAGWVEASAPLTEPTTLNIQSQDGLLKCEITERISATEMFRYARERRAVQKRYPIGAVKRDKFGGVRVIKSEMAARDLFRAEEEALDHRRPIAKQVLVVFGVDLADASWDERIFCSAARDAPKQRWSEIDSVLDTLTIFGSRPFAPAQ